ncbi:deoxyribonuclease-1-like [Littorina saxatilis]
MTTKTLLCCVLYVISHVTEATLTIGAFNIQRMSRNKIGKVDFLKHVAEILLRYDIVSIEEVMDTTASQAVLDEVNRMGGPYNLTISEAMGRTSYKEHLAIIYRSDKVTLTGAVKYPDPDDDFEREPYSAHFHTTQAYLTDFALMGVHLKPTDAFAEMNALVDAYNYTTKVLGTQNFIIAGDYNADCRYLSNKKYHLSNLYTDDRFDFLVNKTADTTANHNTDCAYDRFVATGLVKHAVVSGSVLVYNFETGMHLTYEEAKNISDHYPVEMQLQ